MTQDAITGYARAADALIAQWAKIDQGAFLAPMRRVLPTAPARVLDIGAGPGQCAAALIEQGFDVTAVEPVQAFVTHGKQIAARACWVVDFLPTLTKVTGPPFDAVLLLGVWHHLTTNDRSRSLHRIAELCAVGGILVFALRFGPTHPDRPGHTMDADALVREAESLGLHVIDDQTTASQQPANQAAGVLWRWLAFRKDLQNDQ